MGLVSHLGVSRHSFKSQISLKLILFLGVSQTLAIPVPLDLASLSPLLSTPLTSEVSGTIQTALNDLNANSGDSNTDTASAKIVTADAVEPGQDHSSEGAHETKLSPTSNIMSFVSNTEQAAQGGKVMSTAAFPFTSSNSDDDPVVQSPPAPTSASVFSFDTNTNGDVSPLSDEVYLSLPANVQQDIVGVTPTSGNGPALPTSYHLGPGIAVTLGSGSTPTPSSPNASPQAILSSPFSRIISSPSSDSPIFVPSATSEPTSLADNPNPEKHSNHQLIVVACVVLGLLVLSAVACFLFDFREIRKGFVSAFTRSSRFRKSDSRDSKLAFGARFEKIIKEGEPKLQIRHLGLDPSYAVVGTQSSGTHGLSFESRSASPSPSSNSSRGWLKLPSQLAALQLLGIGNRSSHSESQSSLSPLVSSSFRSLPLSTFSKSSESTSPNFASSSPSSLSSQTRLQPQEIARLQNKVLDIVTDFPRSRWSTTSSDYTPSIREPELTPDCAGPRTSAVTPLMTPEEFFVMASRCPSLSPLPGSCSSPTLWSLGSAPRESPTFSFSLSMYGLSGSEDENGDRTHRRRSSDSVCEVFGRKRRVEGFSTLLDSPGPRARNSLELYEEQGRKGAEENGRGENEQEEIRSIAMF
ncbi:hypothetical protein K435DRAFT_974080 [Dendrothele bispora CBS 962.96]|uniref:Transmembrane protein n=1 Tax=Dendrothele bispora (strain CBS 962.96) TaxID=1314807 RepID=A0A4S8KNG5_DENBC|nr:hypothetical protein K435DRAFT_974080 [Dendrothele bispora CBS 962.96]